jgi:UDP-N-acetylglucosamine--N-acetylmuramyl-(pentapeptide) pyrophosphoryl-undecaprenol N-acetylglucosamine transferase
VIDSAVTDLHLSFAALSSTKGPVLMVADSGGHLQEMWVQAGLLAPDIGRYWVSSDTQMSQSLLSNEANKQLLPTRIFPRRLDLALRAIPKSIRALRSIRPQAVVSTGPAIAVPWLIAARLLRIPAYFIESATFVRHRSMSGKIIGVVPGVKRFSQSNLLGRGWRTAPNVFDLVTRSSATTAPSNLVQRVFVTVGSNQYPFDRLVRRLETVIPPDWEIVWQLSGENAYQPARGRVAGLIPFEEVRELIRTSAVVVSHAGVGSALTAIELGRVPIVCARSAAHNEHVDDHQSDLAQYLQSSPHVIVRDADAISAEDLHDAARR